MSTSTNQEEMLVVERLADRLASWLGDRDGTRHPPPWEPRQYVVLGVLPARISPPPPVATEADRDEPSAQETAEQSVEVSNREALAADDVALPAMTLVFRAAGANESIKVAVELDFALYLEEYATLEEQREYVRYATGEESSGESGTTAEGHEASSEGNVRQGPNEETGRPPRRRRARQTNVGGAWRRLNVHVSGLVIDVPTTEEHVTLSDPIAERVREVIDRHLAGADAARPFTTRTRTVRIDDLAEEPKYRRAIQEKEDAEWVPEYPKLEVTAFAQPLSDDYLVSVSLTNATRTPQRPFQDLSAYDCRIVVKPLAPAAIQPQRFELTPRDYRYMDEISLAWGHGNACVAELRPTGELASTTLPRFYQPEIAHRTDHVPPPRWDELAVNPGPILDAIESAMRTYLEEWDDFLRTATEEVRRESRRERDTFASEIDRFRLGRKAMRTDPRLGQAFRGANAVFAELNTAKGHDHWYLFQVVYIVSQLPALAAREHRDDLEMAAELECADVLWIPTGGGKTEAYLGLLVVALFYDRLRGRERGVTGWLKFPLRMLSVQQLARVLRVLVIAERHRTSNLHAGGSPFELGYLVGGSNTPNQLRWPQGWWPGFDAAKDMPAAHFDEWRLVSECLRRRERRPRCRC